MYVYIYIYICMCVCVSVCVCVCVCVICMWETAVLLFEGPPAELRLNGDLEGAECSNYS